MRCNLQPIIKSPTSLFIGIFITATLLLTNGLWKPLELKSRDLRFRITEALGLGQSHPSGRLVVIGIDERKVLAEKPLMFLYPDIGRFIQKMGEYKAAVIGLDIIPVHEQSEKFKKAVISLYDKIPQPQISFIEETGTRLDKSLLEPIMQVSRDIPMVQAYHGSLTPFYYGMAPFMGNMFHLSDIVLTDGDKAKNDGIIRSQELLPDNRESFAFSITRLLEPQSQPSASYNLNFSLLKNIPVFCFEDVMNGKVGPEAFQGKAVILGYISAHEDAHQTPLSYYQPPSCGGKPEKTALQREVSIPGSLIHAVAAETLLTKTFLKEPGRAIESALLIILGLAGIVAGLKLKPHYGISATLLVMSAYFGCSLFFFSKGWLMPIFPHILAPFLMIAFIYPYSYMKEERLRRKLYKTFGYYVDKEVIDSLIEQDPAHLLQGEYKDAAILFLDIRDFTRLSMQHKAEDMVSLLNLFFGAITSIVKQHNGFVNKFIGDGVLAFFATGENPIKNTLQSAVEILRETQRLNDQGAFKSHIGDAKLSIGMGIHYGKVVMGNIGSEKKMDFTIMGANVNIASRIEGLTKQLKKPILLSDSAYNMLKDEYRFEDLGTHAVKGLDEPIRIYTISEVKDA